MPRLPARNPITPNDISNEIPSETDDLTFQACQLWATLHQLSERAQELHEAHLKSERKIKLLPSDTTTACQSST